MDQTSLPWEYLDGKTYEFRGKKTIWAKGTKSGWGKRQATIHLTISAGGSNRVKPLIIYRGAAGKMSASRKCEASKYDPRVVVLFNPKAYTNTATTTFWLEHLLLPTLRSSTSASVTQPSLLIMDLFRVTDNLDP